MIDVPATITACGVAAGAVLTAWQARTALKVRDLETRLAAVEKERDGLAHQFRIAVRHIRDWWQWALLHAPGVPMPPMPPELLDEV